ncbi:UVR8 [Symbiodinium sp. CCMP2592]|nr:UVR8 [Symbiodinium sp. CCMP2592]
MLTAQSCFRNRRPGKLLPCDQAARSSAILASSLKSKRRFRLTLFNASLPWVGSFMKCGGMRRYRSAASRKLSHQRRASWLSWRAQQHMSLPVDRIWLLYQLAQATLLNTGKFGTFLATTGFERLRGQSRQRDIFPLSQLCGLECKPQTLKTQCWCILRKFVNVVIGALNWCAGVKAGTPGPLKRTAAQNDVVLRIIERSLDMLQRLQTPQSGCWESLVPDWVPLLERPNGPRIGDLCADKVDVLPLAGQCDPVSCLPMDVQEIVCSDDKLFLGSSHNLDNLAVYDNVLQNDRAEYVKLVVRQLRSQQLGLVATAKGGGTVFAVGKPGGKRQRAVWHGRRVSAAAQAPPKPRHLASPSALAFLECRPQHRVRCSKRDASCWFDQLRLPCKLQRWMGRPPVTLDELRDVGGMNFEEVSGHLLPGEQCNQFLVPVSLTWPMGFAWSSYVAQEFLLDICRASDLDECKVLSCESSTPATFDLVFAAATDDLMLFSDAGPGGTAAAALKVDQEFTRRGAVRNSAKDVNDELNATCVGIQLEEGTHLGVPPPRVLAMVLTALHLHRCQVASPKELHQALGVQQWFDLLCRCKLSVYDRVYSFVRDPLDTVRRKVPGQVLFELSVGLVLGVFWRLDLRREFYPLVSATDASTEFGFACLQYSRPR